MAGARGLWNAGNALLLDLCARCTGALRMAASSELCILYTDKCTCNQCHTSIRDMHIHPLPIKGAEEGVGRHGLL